MRTPEQCSALHPREEIRCERPAGHTDMHAYATAVGHDMWGVDKTPSTNTLRDEALIMAGQETPEQIEARASWLVGYAFMQSKGRGFTTVLIEEQRYQKDVERGFLLPAMTPDELAALTSGAKTIEEIKEARHG